MKYIASTFAAALTATVTAFLISPVHVIDLTVFIMALGHTALLWIPAYLLWRRHRGSPSMVICLVGGFFISIVPYAILFWPLDTDSTGNVTVDGVPYLIDGVPTLQGWASWCLALARIGTAGALSAVAFHKVFESNRFKANKRIDMKKGTTTEDKIDVNKEVLEATRKLESRDKRD